MRFADLTSTRSAPLDFQEWVDYFKYNGLNYPFSAHPQMTLGEKEEEPDRTFAGYASLYESNPIVFACMAVRMALFSEARMQFRRRVLGRPGNLFGTQALSLLEKPWPGGTTKDLLKRMIQDADLEGNWFGAKRPGGKVMRLRPDWTTIVLGSKKDTEIGYGDPDAEVLGYIYEPGGKSGTKEPYVFLRDEVAHWAPTPDPLAAWRGMSWLTPVIREVMGDRAASTHKLRFFENGATPNVVVTFDASVKRENFEKWIELFENEYGGPANAYKTMYLGAGAKAESVGADLRAVDFKKVQGSGETRIAAASGVPPIIAGFSEGLESATYSNYGQARRRFADGTMRDLWGGAVGALATLVPPPGGAELWYDSRDIPFLQEDEQDKAEIQEKNARTIRTLIESGYEPQTVIAAVESDDWSLLKHTGLVSVQLQPPGTEFKPSPGALADE